MILGEYKFCLLPGGNLISHNCESSFTSVSEGPNLKCRLYRFPPQMLLKLLSLSSYLFGASDFSMYSLVCTIIISVPANLEERTAKLTDKEFTDTSFTSITMS